MQTRTKKTLLWISIALAAILISIVAFAAIGYQCRIALFDRSGWQGRQYLDYDGKPMLHWQTIDGKTYYFAPDGNYVTGWLTTKYGTYYLHDGGVQTGWLEENGCRYYFGANGKLCTGWTDVDGTLLYLGDNGALYSGWLENAYLEEGLPVSGWKTVDGKQYYFRTDGTIATGRVNIDGVDRFFSSQGEEFILVNAWNELPEGYEVQLELVENEMYVAASIAQQVKTLLADLREQDFTPRLSSAYRDVQAQIDIWWEWYETYINAGENDENARRLTDEVVAKPGTSEHHTGLAVDIAGGWPMFDWLEEHCVEYGFILRFPEGKEEITGITYEPWHFRYVGVEMAQEIQSLGMCLEEYVEYLTK